MKRTVRIALPDGFRRADVLGFHARDVEGVAERVTGDGLQKAVMLDRVPVLLQVQLTGDAARCTITSDGSLPKAASEEALTSILGLRLDPAPFERALRKDAVLGPLVRRQRGLRIVQSASIFEALTWAIIGQQINLPFAIALRRSFIRLAGRQHSSGLWCYPEAQDVAGLDADLLGAHKFSRAKADTLLRVSRMVADGELVLDRAADLETTSAALLAIKGIGPWTVNYALLRGYGYADCSLHGDVAVRAALHKLLQSEERPSIGETEQWLKQFSPHRTLTAAHLWASL
ncbi:MAG TPA: DNA-3-methyladenine glycosylase 2 [Telluria sp.]|nr:DNA-3-methyladenine glycosylase 2 [Telluria sp.]